MQPLEQTLPPFRPAAPIVAAALESLRPPKRIRISEAAAKHRRLNNPGSYVGPWLNEMAPYLVAPMDRFQDRSVKTVVMVGPSQFGKTEVPLNLMCHAAKYAAKDILIVMPTKDLAEDFGERRIKHKLLNTSPDIAAERGGDRSDDKIKQQTFVNGTIVTVAWPSTSQLASRPVQVVILDERDSMPDDIDGEGDPVGLALGRIKTFGSHGKVGVFSSPKRADYSGILPLYDEGDRNLWFWQCPQCGEHFSPGFDADRKPTIAHLRWAPGADAAGARETAYVGCPSCGFPIEQQDRSVINQSALWLPEGVSIDAKGVLRGEPRRGLTASYWMSGLASNFVSWGDLAFDLVSAGRHFDLTGDDDKTRTVHNTGFGFPFRSESAGAAPLDANELIERAKEGHRLGVVPGWAVCLVAAVDIQSRSFEVLFRAYGEGLESAIVDRFSIRQLDDRRTDVDPARHLEHWDVLIGRVFRATYPIEGEPGMRLPVMTVAVDTGGVEGVSDNARKFWHRLKAAEFNGAHVTLIKGGTDRQARTITGPTWLERDRHDKPNMAGPSLWLVNVHRIKDTLDVRLRRTDPGPGAVHLPADLDRRWLDELTAEEKRNGAWEKIRARNETWDLMVYCEAAMIRHGGERSDLSWVPAWARAQRKSAVANGVRTHVREVITGRAAPEAPAKPSASPVDAVAAAFARLGMS